MDIFKILCYYLNFKMLKACVLGEISALYQNMVMSFPSLFSAGKLTLVLSWVMLLFHSVGLDSVNFGGAPPFLGVHITISFVPEYLLFSCYFHLWLFSSLVIFISYSCPAWPRVCFSSLSSVSPSCKRVFLAHPIYLSYVFSLGVSFIALPYYLGSSPHWDPFLFDQGDPF